MTNLQILIFIFGGLTNCFTESSIRACLKDNDNFCFGIKLHLNPLPASVVCGDFSKNNLDSDQVRGYKISCSTQLLAF